MFRAIKGWVARVKDGPVDWDELEALLIQSDLGLEFTDELLDELRKDVHSAPTAREAVAKAIRELWENPLEEPKVSGQEVWFVAGINGAGKTSTIGKLAARYKDRGVKVFLVGADTFRAAAGEQLKVWAERLDVGCYVGPEESDPAAAAYTGVEQAREQGAELILVDTAGRLHNKDGLMRELEKIQKVIFKHGDDLLKQTLLVVDGTNGTNALAQAAEFRKRLDVTGIVVTKLDSSAKGGVIAALKAEQNLDTLWIGTGEAKEDLKVFDPTEYADGFFNS